MIGGFVPSLRNSLVIAKKNLRIMTRYPTGLLFWCIAPMLWMVPFYFQGKALVGDGLQSEGFNELFGSPNFLVFLIVGSLTWSILDAALWGAGNSLRWEQQSGTLEFIWMAPISRTDLLTGASISEMAWASFNVAFQFAVFSIFIQWDLTALDVVLCLAVLLILIIGVFGFGFAFASLVLLFKEPGALTELVNNMLYVISPIRYPTAVLPKFLQVISFLIPFTFGITALRLLLMTTDTHETLRMMAGLLISSLVFWFFGFWAFGKAEAKTKQTGTLGHF